MSGPPIAMLPNVDKDKMAGALEQLKRSAEYLIEHAKVVAKIRRAAYLAYVEQGFTEAQALELCTKP